MSATQSLGDVISSLSLRLEFQVVMEKGKHIVRYIVANSKKIEKRKAHSGILVSGRVDFFADSQMLAERFVAATSKISDWRYLVVKTFSGQHFEIREFLIPPVVLPSVKTDETHTVHQIYTLNRQPRIYCEGYQSFGISTMPNLPRLVFDYVGAAAQKTNQQILFPGPLEKKNYRRFGSLSGWEWNLLQDNHGRWNIPRLYTEINADSPFFGVFAGQREWEAFLETIIGRVMSNYDIVAQMAKLRRTSGDLAEHKEDEQGGESVKKDSFVYDGPSRGMTLVKLGKHFVYIFEVGLLNANPAFVLDLNEYGRSMRVFRSFNEALNHAEGKGSEPVFRVDHDDYRQRRFVERFKTHFNVNFVWE